MGSRCLRFEACSATLAHTMRLTLKALPVKLGAAAGVLALVAVFALVRDGADEEAPIGELADHSGQPEQQAAIIYPCAPTDLTARLPDPEPGEYGFAQPTFVGPDEALLGQAKELACPDRSTLRSFPDFAITLCLPPGWQSEAPPSRSSPQINLTHEPDFSAQPDRLLFAGLVIASSEELASFAFCPEPGLLSTANAVIEVCFYQQAETEDAVFAAVSQLIAFRIQDRPLAGFLHASRMLDDAPITSKTPPSQKPSPSSPTSASIRSCQESITSPGKGLTLPQRW